MAAGAAATALRLGVKSARMGLGEDLPVVDPRSGWNLFSAGLFEGFGVGQWFPGHRHALRLGPSDADFIAAYSDLTGTMPDYPAAQALAGAVLAAHCARQAGDVSRNALWAAAAALDTETPFGGFRIDPATGTQVKHEAFLLRWTPDGLTAVG